MQDTPKPRRGRPPTWQTPRRNVTLALPLDVVERLDKLADETGSTRTELVLEAVQDKLKEKGC